jgi:hypothetical protein
MLLHLGLDVADVEEVGIKLMLCACCRSVEPMVFADARLLIVTCMSSQACPALKLPLAFSLHKEDLGPFKHP